MLYVPYQIILCLVLIQKVFCVPIPHHYRHPGSLDPTIFALPRHQQHAHRLSNNIIIPGSSTEAIRMVDPVSFGADPTGYQDSTESLKAAVAYMLTLSIGKGYKP